MPQKARIVIIPKIQAVVKHADGSTTNLGDVSNPSLKTRWKLYKLRRKHHKA